MGWKSSPFSEENSRAFVHAEYFKRRNLEGRNETGCTGSPHFAMSIQVGLFVSKFVNG